MLVYIQIQKSINSGTKFSFQKILIQHFNYSEKLLVIHSFLLILQTILIPTSIKTNPYNTLRIGLHDKLLNLTHFTPLWFADALTTLFGYQVYKTISIKYNLEQNINIFSSFARGFFSILNAELINDLKEAPSKKRALVPNKTYYKFSLSTITENPLDQTSIDSDYPSDNLQTPHRNDDAHTSNRIIYSPPFYTNVLHVNYQKCQNLNFKFLPKRKSYDTVTIDNSKTITQSFTSFFTPLYKCHFQI